MKRFEVIEYRKFLLGCSAILASTAVSTSASAQDSQPSEWSTAYRYDGEGHVVGVILPDPDGSDGPLKYAATRTRWNTLGQVVSVETGELATWQPSSVAPNSWPNFSVNKIEYSEYDTLGNLVKTRSADATGTSLAVKQVIYDRLGRTICTATRMDPAQWGSQTDACKPQTSSGNGPDRITRNEYDEVGQLRRVSKAVGTSLEQVYAEYSYSANGKQESVTDANRNRAEMRYDGFDRQTEWHFPSKAAINTASGDDYEAYDYDANGNRTALRKRDGRVVTFVFDTLNRMTAKLIPENCAPVQVGACPDGSATRDVYYDYDSRGLQTYARFDSQSGEGVVNTYDGFGSLLSSDTSIGGVTRTVRNVYDSSGNRTDLTYPDGSVSKFAYDRQNRLTAIRDAAGSDLTIVSYYANGGRGWLGYNATGTGYGYDALMRLTGYNNQHNEGGRVIADNATLVYNSASQITKQTRSNDAYTWNGAVNIDRPYGVNGLNQYTGAGANAFSYDANGNLTGETGQTFGYDAENRLISAAGARNAALSYDPLGRLWQVGVPGSSVTRFTYDGDRLIAEYDGGGTLLNRYVHASGADEPVLWYQGSNPSPRQLFADHHGSVISTTEHGGSLIAVNTYDEYGIPGVNNLGRFQYTGQAWLPELGMSYYKARVYSPTLGRFLQTDPIGYDDQMNLYAYTGNDPINGRDPTGKYECATGNDCSRFELYRQALGTARDTYDPESIEFKTLSASLGNIGSPNTPGLTIAEGGTNKNPSISASMNGVSRTMTIYSNTLEANAKNSANNVNNYGASTIAHEAAPDHYRPKSNRADRLSNEVAGYTAQEASSRALKVQDVTTDRAYGPTRESRIMYGAQGSVFGACQGSTHPTCM